MFSRSLTAGKVALRRVCVTPARSFGAHIEPHVRGTHESDYIQRRILNSLPPPPGVTPRTPYLGVLFTFTLFGTLFGLYNLYHTSKKVNVEIVKVEVKDPVTGEPVVLYKPLGIMRPDKNLFGYNVVSVPNHDYSDLEYKAASRMHQYNQEMDLWVNARSTCPPLPKDLAATGMTQEEFFARYVNNMLKSFRFFKPSIAAQPTIDTKVFISEDFLKAQADIIASRK